MRQKGWTILTVVILELIAQQYPIYHTILGQGDNQVIISRITSHHRDKQGFLNQKGDEVKMIHKVFMEALNETLEKTRFPLKSYETWSSSKLFMYWKEMYCMAMSLSMSQKRVARMFPLAKEMYTSLENALFTICCIV